MSQIEKRKSGEIKNLLIKNYFETKITWSRVLDLLYKNGENVQIIDPLWIKIKDRKVFPNIPEIEEFILKLNVDFGFEFNQDCDFNNNWDSGRCYCDHTWHMDGFVVSLAPKSMGSHKDVHDSCYLQLVGDSFWELDGKEIIKLEPGDLLFVSQDTTHKVWGNGPRAGILFVEKMLDPRHKLDPRYKIDPEYDKWDTQGI
jgi:hypothetical protein